MAKYDPDLVKKLSEQYGADEDVVVAALEMQDAENAMPRGLDFRRESGLRSVIGDTGSDDDDVAALNDSQVSGGRFSLADLAEGGAPRSSATSTDRVMSLSDFADYMGYEAHPTESKAAEKPKRTFGEVASDTLKQAAAGVNSVIGSVPNLIDPTSEAAEFFNNGKKFWDEQQSEPMKAMLAKREMEIQNAAKNGEWEAFKTSLSTALSEPAIASKIVFETLPSMLPVLGAGKAAEMISVVGNVAPKAAAWLQRGTMAGANATLTAGDARQNAYEDLYKTYVDSGLNPEEAKQRALEESRTSASVGAGFGLLGGAFGAEANVLGKTVGKTATGRAATAFGTEVGTELGEELGPLATTNAIAGQTDGRDLTKGFGRTAADTLIGVGPMATMGAAAAAVSKPTAPSDITDPNKTLDESIAAAADMGLSSAVSLDATGSQLVSNVDSATEALQRLYAEEARAAQADREISSTMASQALDREIAQNAALGASNQATIDATPVTEGFTPPSYKQGSGGLITPADTPLVGVTAQSTPAGEIITTSRPPSPAVIVRATEFAQELSKLTPEDRDNRLANSNLSDDTHSLVLSLLDQSASPLVTPTDTSIRPREGQAAISSAQDMQSRIAATGAANQQTVNATASDLDAVSAVSPSGTLALPSPDTTRPGGIFVAGAEGVRPSTYGESQQLQEPTKSVETLPDRRIVKLAQNESGTYSISGGVEAKNNVDEIKSVFASFGLKAIANAKNAESLVLTISKQADPAAVTKAVEAVNTKFSPQREGAFTSSEQIVFPDVTDDAVDNAVDNAPVNAVVAPTLPSAPAMPGPVPKELTDEMGTTAVEIDPDQGISAVDSLQSGQASKWRMQFAQRMIKMFSGRKARFYKGGRADGFSDGRNVWINADSKIDLIAVAGHEWRHTLKTALKDHHANIQSSTVNALKKLNSRGLLRDYIDYYNPPNAYAENLGITLGEGQSFKDYLTTKLDNGGHLSDEEMDMIAEEFSSDVTGNMWRDPKALQAVFDSIIEAHPPSMARTIIKGIGDAVIKFLDKLILSSPKSGFATGEKTVQIGKDKTLDLRMDRADLEAIRSQVKAAMRDSFLQSMRGKPLEGKAGDVKYARLRAEERKGRTLDEVRGRIAADHDLTVANNPRLMIDGRPFVEMDTKEAGTGVLFPRTNAASKLQAMLEKAAAESLLPAEELAKVTVPTVEFLDDAFKLPAEARFWYELSAYGFGGGYFNLSKERTEHLIDIVAATSGGQKPTDNVRVAIAAMAQETQNKPVTVGVRDSASLTQSLSPEALQTHKFGNFSDTMQLLAGLRPGVEPLPTIDLQMAAVFKMPHADIASNPVMYETLSRFLIMVRDEQNKYLGKSKQPYESWQIQALAWVLQRGTSDPDSYDTAMPKIVKQLNEAGIPTPGGKVTEETLRDPRTPDVLAPSAKFAGEAQTATIETRTMLTEVGKESAATFDALQGIDAPWARKLRDEFSAIQRRTMKALGQRIKLPTRKTRVSSLVGQLMSFAAGKEVYNWGASRVDTDGMGTFEGDLSPNMRVPLLVTSSGGATFEDRNQLLTPEQSRFVLAVLGKALNQAAMASSQFVPTTLGKHQTFSILVRNYGNESAPTEALDKISRSLGRPINYSQVANGWRIDINVGGFDPVTDEAVVENAVDDAFGKDVDAIKLPMSYDSEYMEAGDYDSTIDGFLKEIENGLQNSDTGGVGRTRGKPRRDIGDFTRIQQAIGEVASEQEQAFAKWNEDAKVKLAKRRPNDAGRAVAGGSTTKLSPVRQQKGSVTAEGVHYSNTERKTLSSSAFGTGLKGAELERVQNATDPRIKHRIYFYVNGGNGINPEAGVGAHAHKANLSNLYDHVADSDDLKLGRDANEFESAVLDAGYDGYVDTDRGVAILLGQRTQPVEYVGLGQKPTVEKVKNAPQSDYGKAVQSVMNNNSLPGGQMNGASWKRLMPKLMPEVDVSHLEDGKDYYRNQIVALPGKNGIKLSPTRTETVELKNWAGDTTIRDAEGKLQVMYHGTARDITTFKPKQADAIFLTYDPKFAEGFADMSQGWMVSNYSDWMTPEQIEKAKAAAIKAIKKDNPPGRWRDENIREVDNGYSSNDYLSAEITNQLPSNANIMPLYVRAENPFDYRNPEHTKALEKAIGHKWDGYEYMNGEQYETTFRIGDLERGEWNAIESDAVQNYIRQHHDSFWVRENGTTNLAVFDPNQVKSASGNNGQYSRENNDIRFSTVRVVDQRPLPKDYPTNLKNTSAVRLWAMKHLRNKVATVRSTGDKITVYRNGIEASVKNRSDEARKLYPMLLDIIEESAFVDEVENTDATKPRIKSYTTYIAAVRIDGQIRPVRIKVDNVIDESRGPGYYYHQVDEVSVDAPVGYSRRLSQRSGLPGASMDEISVSDLLGMRNSVNLSTPRIVGDSGRKRTQEQLDAFKNVGREVDEKNILERLHAWISKRWQQGLFDQFAPFRKIDKSAYTLMRLAKGASGAFEAFMKHGKLSIKDGAFDADTSGGVIDSVFVPLGKETTDFLYWIAANRAERLAMEGKERLMTAKDIAALKSLADGKLDFDYVMSNGQVTRDRTDAYKDSLKKFNDFNKNVMDMAEQSGLIDGASRHLWEHEFYVPFYRVMEDEESSIRGMNIKQGLVRQKAFEKLKGGDQKLGDLLSNTLMNWAHLIDASAKNRAAKAAIEAAENMGLAHAAVPGEKKTVWFMDGGKKAEYKIDDTAVMEAITGLEYAGMNNMVMRVLQAPKHWLTVGVTASPFFKVKNLIRDSLQVVATSDISGNIGKNLLEGYKLTNRERQEYVSALAAGGLIRFGTMLEGSEAARTRQLIKKGAVAAEMLDSEPAYQRFYDRVLEPILEAYNEVGNRGEEINRMALYDQLRKRGVSHAEAALQARDLMDFSLQGSFTTVRFLAQVLPFFNARVQGMYKLGRSTKEHRAQMATMLFVTSLFGLALMAFAAMDDDRWKKWKRREEWDKASYWYLSIGSMEFRIPKPFELGAVAHLAERTVEAMGDKERDAGKRYAKAILDVAVNQLAMNPFPQAVKPIVDLYANKDSFTQRPIETMAMERLDKQERYTAKTWMGARHLGAVSHIVNKATLGVVPELSPVQMEHMVHGYFSWLGAFTVGGADMIERSMNNEPTQPSLDYFKFATGGMVQDDPVGSRYISQVYEQAKELEQAHATYNRLKKEGKIEEAKEYKEDNKDKLLAYRSVENVKKQLSKINERIRMIERSAIHPAEKRIKLRELKQRESDLSERLTKSD